VEEIAPSPNSAGLSMPRAVSELPPSLSIWINGASDELAL
jgi:hypothetical protein